MEPTAPPWPPLYIQGSNRFLLHVWVCTIVFPRAGTDFTKDLRLIWLPPPCKLAVNSAKISCADPCADSGQLLLIRYEPVRKAQSPIGLDSARQNVAATDMPHRKRLVGFAVSHPVPSSPRDNTLPSCQTKQQRTQKLLYFPPTVKKENATRAAFLRLLHHRSRRRRLRGRRCIAAAAAPTSPAAGTGCPPSATAGRRSRPGLPCGGCDAAAIAAAAGWLPASGGARLGAGGGGEGGGRPVPSELFTAKNIK